MTAKNGEGLMVALEVCVDTIEGVAAAKAGGATRVELCAALSEGGLTPPLGLMRAAAAVGIQCYAMIRPRSGLFDFSEAEIAMMHDDIQAARDAGLDGVVLGVQMADGRLDLDALRDLCASAGEMGKTLHRVIDVVPDPMEALDQVIALGFDRVLTSGTAPEAPEGCDVIAAMVARAAGRLSVMPGCGLTPENVVQIVGRTGASEVHAACNAAVSDAETFSDFDPPSGRMKTDPRAVAAMVSALAH
ncbi:MAG: copper homeostasis protein CutC [Pseudomonadota bacterium]